MGNIEVRCPYSKQIKTVVNSLNEYAAIALKSNGVRYEAYNRETGIVTNLDNIGAEGHR